MDSFVDSRRLTGPNRHFGGTGAVLEAITSLAQSAGLIARWRAQVVLACSALGWPAPELDARRHAGSASLALAAPLDQLFVATEINEWAWQRAAQCNDGFHAPGHPAPWDEASGLRSLQALSAGERNPALMALAAAAQAHGVGLYVDDDTLSLGDGKSSRSWPLAEMPAVADVPWAQLASIRKAVVTGSNGKTTTVRLLAALLREIGLCTGHSCTDGLFVDNVPIAAGDYSGPAGARSILRDPRVEAAVLETARGGILRRGLAMTRADVAVLTGISADHFGEYGVDDLDDLARTKLAVAHLIDAQGLLVLNADDATSVRHAAGLACPVGWFARDDAHPLLVVHRAAGGRTCGVHEGELVLSHGSTRHALGAIADMPLTLGGIAGYNISNLAGAALAGAALGAPLDVLARVLQRFGAERGDNEGRLMRWRIGGFSVLLDYAHNPEGLDGLLAIANHQRGSGRLGLLLGQAGNRGDSDVRRLASTAARHHPQRIVLKDIENFLRGRAPGEIPAILRMQLLADGLPATALATELDEVQAARSLVGWAQPGDVVVLPVHARRAREAICAFLNTLEASAWQQPQPLPALAAATPAPGSV